MGNLSVLPLGACKEDLFKGVDDADIPEIPEGVQDVDMRWSIDVYEMVTGGESLGIMICVNLHRRYIRIINEHLEGLHGKDRKSADKRSETGSDVIALRMSKHF